MRLPSGDQAGARSAEPAVWVVSCCRPDPSGWATKIRKGSPGPVRAAYTIWVPFGSQEGSRSGTGVEVTLVRAPPVAFMTNRSARPVIPARRT